MRPLSVFMNETQHRCALTHTAMSAGPCSGAIPQCPCSGGTRLRVEIEIEKLALCGGEISLLIDVICLECMVYIYMCV